MENAVQSLSFPYWGLIYALLGAFLAVLLGGLGSSLGIRTAGQKAAGVLAEKPNLFGSLVTLVVLPGSQGIYGLLIAIMIFLEIGVVGGAEVIGISTISGIAFLVAGLITGLAGLFTALYQAKVVSAAVSAVAKDESSFGGAIVMSVLIETYAIFALLISMFIIWSAIGLG